MSSAMSRFNLICEQKSAHMRRSLDILNNDGRTEIDRLADAARELACVGDEFEALKQLFLEEQLSHTKTKKAVMQVLKSRPDTTDGNLFALAIFTALQSSD